MAEGLEAAEFMERQRARSLGLVPGILPTGPLNAITDVVGVSVGHLTRHEGVEIHTGVTAILPHDGNLFKDKVPAGLAVGNGFGKLLGATQLRELGELETPILLTNTLAVPRAADALLDWTLDFPGNEDVRSVNPVVGETNDGYLNDIRRRVVAAADGHDAIVAAQNGAVQEGSVGAGAGTVCFGWKGGIGTSSRQLPPTLGGYTLGALVQANFGGILQILGAPVGQHLQRYYLHDQIARHTADGSIMIILATDAPLSDRNLERLAWRAFAGLARTGAAFSNGSGDYALAFSTAPDVRRTPERRAALANIPVLPNELMSPLFLAAVEATEEAIYNALFTATTVAGRDGHIAEALPLAPVLHLLHESDRLL